MVNQNEVIDYLLAMANHNSEKVDWKQLFYGGQIIYGEKAFSSFVKKLEQYALLATQVKYYINPDYVEEVQKMILDNVMTYIYAIAAKSSENGGELLQRISTESKRVDYNMFGGEKGKPEGMFSKIKNFDRSKITEPLKNEHAGMSKQFSQDFKA